LINAASFLLGADALTDTAKTLAATVAKNLYVSAIVLVVVLVLVAATVIKQSAMTYGALLLAAVGMVLVTVLALSAQGSVAIGPLVFLGLIIVVLGGIAAVFTFRQRPAPAPAAVVTGSARKPLEFEATEKVLDLMTKLVSDVAKHTAVGRRQIRACVFAKCPGDKIRMVPSLTIRMSQPETTIELPIGTGVSGKAFEQRTTLAGRFKPGAKRGHWEWQGVPPGEASKVNRDLRWVVAQAIPLSDPRAVLSVDSLRDTSEDRLQTVIKLVRGYGPSVRDLIANLELPAE